MKFLPPRFLTFFLFFVFLQVTHEDQVESDEEFIGRYRRDVERHSMSNFREPRFLDFYTCISSSGTLGMCLPQPYCSYMITGAILDPTPTKGCSHTMLSDYGCCTLPCNATNVPLRTGLNLSPTDIPPPIVITTSPPTTTTMTTTTTAAVTAPPLVSSPIITSPNDFLTCGRTNPNFVEVTRNGPRDTQLAPTGKWCWQAAIMDSSLTFKCGGTLLNSRHILTVAHCVQKSPASSLLIRLGDTNLRSSDDNQDLIDLKVSKVTIHPDYTGQSPFQNNLAVLTLDKDVPTNRNRICSVCLPTLSAHTEIESMFFRGSPNGRCVTSGYGKLDSHDEFPLMRLKEVPVPLISNDQCTAILQGLLGSKFTLPDTFLCAGGEGLSDGCEYDGGGPMVCPISSTNISPDGQISTVTTYVLTGVVTWGVDCAKVGVPGVYTRITNYTSWIRDSVSGF